MEAEQFNKLKAKMDWVYYACGTYAFYDTETDKYYNQFGQQLKNPKDYIEGSDGDDINDVDDEDGWNEILSRRPQ